MNNTLKIETANTQTKSVKKKMVIRKIYTHLEQEKIYSVYIKNTNTIYYNLDFAGTTKMSFIRDF